MHSPRASRLQTCTLNVIVLNLRSRNLLHYSYKVQKQVNASLQQHAQDGGYDFIISCLAFTLINVRSQTTAKTKITEVALGHLTEDCQREKCSDKVF